MNLFDLAAKITLDPSEYEKGVKNISGGVSRLGGVIKNGLGVAAKATAAAVGAAAAGLATIVKSSVDAYGEYEQLVGGINKLFGEGSQQLQEYASQAYMTSGMSANQYMQNVTGFSAALINSLDGDTVRAAEIADMAMRDISDNANTYGKYSAEELANVYQALAKEQYQTLDNLNLGFGGSKEGMQSLIDKANELRAAQGLTADLSIDSYADIVQAIHEVQSEMGITGTTANEAAGTIQGSLASTKAAWQNLLVAFGSGEGVEEAIGNLVSTAATTVKNVIPVVKQALTGIAGFVKETGPIIIQELPGLIQELLPGLLSAAVSLVGSLIQAIPGILSALWETIKSLFSTLWDSLKENPELSNVFDGIVNAFQNAREAIKNALGSLKEFFKNVWDGIATAVSPLIDSVVGAFQAGWNLIQTIWNLPAVQAIWQGIVSTAQSAWEVIQTVWSIAKDFFALLWESVKDAASAVWSIISGAAQVAWGAIQAIWSAASGYFQAIWNTIAGIFNAASAVLQGDFEGAYDAIKGVVDGWGDYFQGVWDDIAAVFDDAVNVGKDIVDGILSGIESGWESLVGWVSSAWERVKGLFSVDVSMPDGSSAGSHAIGLDYVPYNNYPAILHRGEAVLTAREADAWRRGGSGGGGSIQITQNIQTVPMTPVEVAETTAAYFEMARWAI